MGGSDEMFREFLQENISQGLTWTFLPYTVEK